MIKIVSNNVNGQWIFKIIGRMDVTGAKEADEILNQKIKGAKDVVLDCSEMDYVSSAGLRSFRHIKFTMDKQKGKLVIRGIKPEVKSVFDLTGFDALFDFE